jgi:hypothetical protein
MMKIRSIGSLNTPGRLVYAWIVTEEIVRDRKCKIYRAAPRT